MILNPDFPLGNFDQGNGFARSFIVFFFGKYKKARWLSLK